MRQEQFQEAKEEQGALGTERQRKQKNGVKEEGRAHHQEETHQQAGEKDISKGERKNNQTWEGKRKQSD